MRVRLRCEKVLQVLANPGGKGERPKERRPTEQPLAAKRVSIDDSFAGREDVPDQARKGGSLDRDDGETGAVSGAERDQ